MPKRPNSCISYRVSCIYEAIRCLYSGGRVIGPRHFSPLRPFDSSPSLSLSNDPPSFSTTRRGGLGQVTHEKKLLSLRIFLFEGLRFFHGKSKPGNRAITNPLISNRRVSPKLVLRALNRICIREFVSRRVTCCCREFGHMSHSHCLCCREDTLYIRI